MRNETKGTLAILGSSLGYGGLAVLAKIALLRGVGVIPLLAWRFVIAATLLAIVALLARNRLPTRRQIRGIVLLGALYSGNSIAFMVGLDRIPAGLASLIFFTYPAVVVVLARLFLGERLTGRRIISLMLASAGCGLIVGQGVATVDVVGVAWVLLSVGLIATFIMLSHDIMAETPAISGTAILLGTTAAVTAAIGGATGDLVIPFDPLTILVVVALGVTATAIPVTLFLLGIRWIGPARASIFSTLEPLITVLLAAVLLSERLLPLQMLGGSLILAGVIWLRLEPTTLEDSPH